MNATWEWMLIVFVSIAIAGALWGAMQHAVD